MAESKIGIKIGIVEFSGEGKEDWLAAQLDKILLKVPELVKIEMKMEAAADSMPAAKKQGLDRAEKPANLSIFLKEKNATSVQTKKFLATAAYLQLGGKKRQTTADVSKALKDYNQTKLNNPSDCLNQNVTKGFCEKDGDSGFFVTENGMTDLGLR